MLHRLRFSRQAIVSNADFAENAIKTNIPVSQGLPSSVRATGYNDTEANSLVRAAYTKIFNRVPTDLDLNSPANVTDPNTGQVMKDPKDKSTIDLGASTTNGF